MPLSFRSFVGAALACAAPVALAQSEISSYDLTTVMLGDGPQDGKTEGWFGTASLGYLATTGNTDSSSANGQFTLGRVDGPWRNVGTLKAIRGSTEGVVNAEEYAFTGQSDYRLDRGHYLFAALNFAHDSFGAYRQRASEVVGYGRRLIATDTHLLDAQIGVGARQLREQDGTRRNEGIVAGLVKYDYKLSANSVFTQRLTVESGNDNTYGESVTALTARLLGRLALSVTYTVKHNTSVPPDTERTDTSTAISLIYGF